MFLDRLHVLQPFQSHTSLTLQKQLHLKTLQLELFPAGHNMTQPVRVHEGEIGRSCGTMDNGQSLRSVNTETFPHLKQSIEWHQRHLSPPESNNAALQSHLMYRPPTPMRNVALLPTMSMKILNVTDLMSAQSPYKLFNGFSVLFLRWICETLYRGSCQANTFCR